MNKPNLTQRLLRQANLMNGIFAMTLFSLLITWSIELLAKELCRLN